MLTLTGLTKSFGGAAVLRGVSLTCAGGEAVCVAGANAAGKTTLLTIAGGLQRPDSGTVVCEGGVGCVPQETALLTDLSVRENLTLWYAAQKRPRKELFSPDSVETMLGLLPFAKQRVSRLSGGLKKRAAIACALIGSPACLLMDEPFTALDLQSRTEILKLLCTLKTQGRGLLFTSHEPAAIAAIADRVLLLQEGVVAAEIRPDGDLDTRTAEIITLLSRA